MLATLPHWDKIWTQPFLFPELRTMLYVLHRDSRLSLTLFSPTCHSRIPILSLHLLPHTAALSALTWQNPFSMDIILPGDKGRIWFPQSINLTQSLSLQRSNSVGRKELTQVVQCRRHMGEKLRSQVNLKTASFPVLRKCLHSVLRKLH